jgi:hypothetical protein
MITHRRGEARDVPIAAELFVEALIDLCRRNGVSLAAPTPANMLPAYAHLHATGVFEVAEEDGAMVAFAMGLVRDGHFFLSMFWTRPTRQRRGIGRPLLDRVWSEARARGARTYAVWSSIDWPAIGLYLRFGMRPLGPIFTMGGVPRTKLEIDVEIAPLEAGVAERIDRDVRGSERAVDHAFFAREKKTARVVRVGDRVLGYFYEHDGRIGPVAWSEAASGPRVLAAAIASTRGPSIVLAIPGPNRTALDLAVALGLEIQGTSHYMASEVVGRIDQYLPSGPALF